MRASLYHYEAGPSRVGYAVERPSHGSLELGTSDETIAWGIESIGYQSLANAVWVKQVSAEHGVDPSDLARQVFDPSDDAKLADREKRVKASSRMGKQLEYWIGEVIPPMPEGTDHSDMTPTAVSAQGFSIIEQYGPKERTLVSAAQYLSGIGITVVMHNWQSLPLLKRHTELPEAIRHAALKDQPSMAKAIIIAPEQDLDERAYAERAGFTLARRFPYDRFFEGITVPFVLYETPHVIKAIHKMERAMPWLKDIVGISETSRYMDERDRGVPTQEEIDFLSSPEYKAKQKSTATETCA
jgi:hypothetical protein